MRKTMAAALLAASPLALAACGDESDRDNPTAGSDIAESEPFNQADVAFATDMIQHHAQALSMVDLTVRREISPELAELADQIRMAQGPEIEAMVDWLTEWDQPVPETMRDHANAHGGGEMGDDTGMDSDMPGMMSAEDMADLEAAEGPEFEQMWLQMMIEHHEGAIEMAKVEQKEGEYPDALALAENIETTQAAEIATMNALLGS